MRGNRRHWRLVLAICLPLAVLAGGWLWALQQPDPIGVPTNAELLPMLLNWLPVVAGIAAVFAVSGWWYGSRLSLRLAENRQQQQQLETEEREARDHLQRLNGMESVPLNEVMALLSAARDRDLAGLADEFASGSGAVLLDAEQFAGRRRLLRDRVVVFTEGLIRMRDEAAATMKELDAQIATDGDKRDALKQDIDVERERVDKYLALHAVAENLRERIEDLGHRMRVRALSIDLLEGAIHYISQRFNTEVRNLSADSLLKFTNGRYEHLQIDQDLNVKAFSAEKRDFMQLDEISSGTQRQIMLAVRMSLSQKLVNSVIQGPQMLFLDEPFAFFDEDRTASSLAVLPEVSGDFTQIWVTSQKFPARSHFDIHIECNARESVSPWISYTGEASPDA